MRGLHAQPAPGRCLPLFAGDAGVSLARERQMPVVGAEEPQEGRRMKTQEEQRAIRTVPEAHFAEVRLCHPPEVTH